MIYLALLRFFCFSDVDQDGFEIVDTFISFIYLGYNAILESINFINY